MVKPFSVGKHKTILALLVPAILMSGCAFRDLQKEVQEAQQLYTLAGNISGPLLSPAAPVIVVVYAPKGDTFDIVGYAIASDTGHFAFALAQGTYLLATFEDLNFNLSYDKGELAG